MATALRAELTKAVTTDLINCTPWAEKELGEKYPGYEHSPRWEDKDTIAFLPLPMPCGVHDAIEAVVDDVASSYDIEDAGNIETEVELNLRDFWGANTWADYGVHCSYGDGEGNIYTLREYVEYLKAGVQPVRMVA